MAIPSATLDSSHFPSELTGALVRRELLLKNKPLFFVDMERSKLIKLPKFPLASTKLNSKKETYCRDLKFASDALSRSRNRIAGERVYEAYRDIAELDDEMKADSFPLSTAAMKDEARRIVVALAGSGIVPTVYGTQDGDIAIQFDSEESAVIIELSRVGGAAACFSDVRGKNRRARYDDSKDLPDDFVRSQLREL